MFHYNISRKKYFQTKLCTKYEKNDKLNLQKKVLYFTSTYNYIYIYTRYKFSLKLNFLRWICKTTRLLQSIVHTQSLVRTNFISFVSEKDFRVSYFDKKKNCPASFEQENLFEDEWRKRRRRKKKRGFSFFFFFSKSIKKLGGKNLHIMSRDNKNTENNGTDFCKLLCTEILLSSYV